jgi:hypothetical protein
VLSKRESGDGWKGVVDCARATITGCQTAVSGNLKKEKALVFRIVHLDYVASIMASGMHCRNSTITDLKFVTIGNPDLIDKRRDRDVPCAPFGTLGDYIPFYFTPFTPMLLNIKTGYNGILRRPNEEIVIFVSSLLALRANAVPFLFTDRRAYLIAAQFSADLSALDRIDWALLRRRDFKRDPDDPGKFERYQAEALVYRHMPMKAALGVVCYTDTVRAAVQREVAACGHTLKVISRPEWYFK